MRTGGRNNGRNGLIILNVAENRRDSGIIARDFYARSYTACDRYVRRTHVVEAFAIVIILNHADIADHIGITVTLLSYFGCADQSCPL